MRVVAIFGNKTARRFLTRKKPQRRVQDKVIAMPEPAADTIVRNLIESLERLRGDLDRMELWAAARSLSASNPGLPTRGSAFAESRPETTAASAGVIKAFDGLHKWQTVIFVRGRDAPRPRPILGQKAMAFLRRQNLEKRRSDNMLVTPLLSYTDHLFGVQDSPIHTCFLEVIRKPHHG
jgi:hypothetical protein